MKTLPSPDDKPTRADLRSTSARVDVGGWGELIDEIRAAVREEVRRELARGADERSSAPREREPAPKRSVRRARMRQPANTTITEIDRKRAQDRLRAKGY